MGTPSAIHLAVRWPATFATVKQENSFAFLANPTGSRFLRLSLSSRFAFLEPSLHPAYPGASLDSPKPDRTMIQSPLYGMYPWAPESQPTERPASHPAAERSASQPVERPPPPAEQQNPPANNDVAEGRVKLSSSKGEVEVDWVTFENVLFNLFAGEESKRQTVRKVAEKAVSDPNNPDAQKAVVQLPGQDKEDTQSKTNVTAATNDDSSRNDGRPAKRAKRGKAFDINADGYKWRKYGQKLLTLSQQYREYFRCSHPGCPAKKHVEVVPETGVIVGSSSTPHNHDNYSQYNQRASMCMVAQHHNRGAVW